MCHFIFLLLYLERKGPGKEPERRGEETPLAAPKPLKLMGWIWLHSLAAPSKYIERGKKTDFSL